MPRHVWIVAVLASGALSARPAAAEDKELGVVALKTQGLDRSSERAANAQLKLTLSAIAGLSVVDVRLAPGKAANDLGALKAAVKEGALHRVVGGEITFEDEGGRIRLVSVDAAGKPSSAIRELPNQRQEELLSAVEAAACEAVAEDSSAAGCQGALALEGALDLTGAELWIDGKKGPSAPFVLETPIPIGPHMVQLRQGQLVSQERRFFVHYEAAVKLRISAQCGRLFILDVGETEICDDSALLSQSIASTLLIPPPDPPKWPAIITTAAGALLLVGGTIAGLQASGRAGDIQRAYEGQGLTADDAAQLTEMRQSALAANVLLGLGGATTIVGGLLFFEF